MPSDKAMQEAHKIAVAVEKRLFQTEGYDPCERDVEVITPIIANAIDTALAEACLEGARAMQAAAASELVNQHASAEIDGYQASSTVDALDPQQVINESVK